TDDNLSSIVDRYPDLERQEIYKPIIELYQNENITIDITDKSFINIIRPINRITNEKRDKILFKKTLIKDKPVETQRVAMISYNEKTKKGHIEPDGIFEQNIIPGWGKDE